MKKRITALTMAFALASLVGMAAPAAAANLHVPQQGTECNGAVCVWHLVNVQAGSKPHDLTLDNISLTHVSGASIAVTKDNRNVVHWEVTTTRASSGAPQVLNFLSTTNGGKIVISDVYCKCGCPCG